jgi:hypothetical protein
VRRICQKKHEERRSKNTKLFKTDIASEADLKVFVIDIRPEANLVVYKADVQSDVEWLNNVSPSLSSSMAVPSASGSAPFRNKSTPCQKITSPNGRPAPPADTPPAGQALPVV